jgi:hypothetical protein
MNMSSHSKTPEQESELHIALTKTICLSCIHCGRLNDVVVDADCMVPDLLHMDVCNLMLDHKPIHVPPLKLPTNNQIDQLINNLISAKSNSDVSSVDSQDQNLSCTNTNEEPVVLSDDTAEIENTRRQKIKKPRKTLLKRLMSMASRKK